MFELVDVSRIDFMYTTLYIRCNTKNGNDATKVLCIGYTFADHFGITAGPWIVLG